MSSAHTAGFDHTEYAELGRLARDGLAVVGDAEERRAVLLETAALADFLRDRMPVLQKEWEQHRNALREAGELP